MDNYNKLLRGRSPRAYLTSVARTYAQTRSMAKLKHHIALLNELHSKVDRYRREILRERAGIELWRWATERGTKIREMAFAVEYQVHTIIQIDAEDFLKKFHEGMLPFQRDECE
jgi:hypothetical protein